MPIGLLAVVLYWAVARPKGLPEIAVALPAAALVVVFGFESAHQAGHQIDQLKSVVIFLAAILVLADACARDGLFDAAGAYLGRASKGRPKPLLRMVFVVATLTTSVLSLDATVVLLTPVVIRAAKRSGVDAKPVAYASGHLANSASLLLPVSNLTNLLAFTATGLTFLSFGAHMLLPTILTVVVEYVVLALWFRKSLRVESDMHNKEEVHWPKFSLTVVILTLVGFGVSSLFGIEPVWVALVGAGVMVIKGLVKREVSVGRLVKSANIGFCLFVLCLAVIVEAVAGGAVGTLVRHLTPNGDSLLALLAIAFVAAIASNILNNIPATLLMLAILGTGDPSRLLAMLLGVNIGPNLTYVGSLATLLWRKAVKAEQIEAPITEFTAVGFISVVSCLFAAVLGLAVTK